EAILEGQRGVDIVVQAADRPSLMRLARGEVLLGRAIEEDIWARHTSALQNERVARAPRETASDEVQLPAVVEGVSTAAFDPRDRLQSRAVLHSHPLGIVLELDDAVIIVAVG